MTIVAYLASVATFAYVGYMFGASMRTNRSLRSVKVRGLQGRIRIKGYSDCWAAKEADKKYYDDFPDMGIN
jgi:hypothetical protein